MDRSEILGAMRHGEKLQAWAPTCVGDTRED